MYGETFYGRRFMSVLYGNLCGVSSPSASNFPDPLLYNITFATMFHEMAHKNDHSFEVKFASLWFFSSPESKANLVSL